MINPEEKSATEMKDTNEGGDSDSVKESSWEHDQKNRDYYYDDTCGYAVYEPEPDEDEETQKVN